MVRMVNGTPRPFGDDKPKGGGARMLVVAGALVAVVGTGGGLSLGAAGGLGVGAASEGIAGNLAGDVTDSLPGRDLATRRSEGRKSAQRGKTSETWSRLGVKELKRVVRQEIKQAKCEAAATGKVREFLARTPCTSLQRALWALGDGHGNAAIVSVAWVGFRTRADAEAFERVERVQGSGDIEPLGGALLDLKDMSFTGHHYGAHRERTIMAIAEVEIAAGRLDVATLDTIADVSAWLPVPKQHPSGRASTRPFTGRG